MPFQGSPGPLHVDGNPAGYWIVPEYVRHRDVIAAHGGQRPRSPDSKHFGIFAKNVTAWRDRWDLLRIF